MSRKGLMLLGGIRYMSPAVEAARKSDAPRHRHGLPCQHHSVQTSQCNHASGNEMPP